MAQGASTKTEWKNKTPEEILRDVNEAITDAWAAAQYDNSAIPNHILIDPANYAYINMTPLTVAGVPGGISIMKYLMENNIATLKGVDLFIGECRFCEKAGTGQKNRMICYVNNKRFVGMDVPVPLARVMTQPNINNGSYDSLYMANVGQVKVHYYEPFIYREGI